LPSPVAGTPGLGVLDFGLLLVGTRGRSNETYSVSESVSGRRFTPTSSPQSRRSSHSRHPLEDGQRVRRSGRPRDGAASWHGSSGRFGLRC
jgi:hypothetical protein